MKNNLNELHTKSHNYNNIKEDINNNLLYAIAWDYENDKKKYYSFNNYIDFENIINHINRKHNNKFEVKNRIYYEVIGNKCKPYFDIDIKDMLISKNEFETFIKNKFINYFNAYMNTNINYENMLIYTRDINNENISSIHIIIPNYQVEKNIIKEFLKYLKYINNETITEYFDTKIYTKNRLFNLPYNTKLKKILDNPNNPLYFEDYKLQLSNPKDYLVSYRFGLETIDIKNNNKYFKGFIKLNNLLLRLRNAFNKLKNNEKNITEIKEKTKIYFDNPNEAFDFICLNLPSEFYNNSNDWKFLTYLFKKYDITYKQFEIWNEISINKTKNKLWTADKNISFYNAIDKSKIKSGMPKLKSIIEKYLTDYEIIFNDKNNDLINWIINYTKLDKKIIQENLNDKNITNGVYTFGNYQYLKFNGFLQYTENDFIKIIANFYHEIAYKKIYESQKIKNMIEFEKIEDTYELVDNFINDNKKIFCLKAKWGSGKSYLIIKRLIEKFQELNFRNIFLTENNALNKQIEKTFKSEKFNIISHIDKNYLLLKNTDSNIVCSLESIQKINFKDNDILILDEFESLLNHFESDTFENENLQKFKLFKQALLKCKKIILTDADISQQRIELIENILNEKITTIQANTNNFNDYNFNVFLNTDILFKQLKYEIKNTTDKICFASSVRKKIEDLYKDFIIEFPKKIILKLDGNGVDINIKDLKLKKNEVLENLEKVIIDYKVDIFLFSPTIKTGVSINTEYFDKCYAYGSHNSLCVREFIQMLFRARNLKLKEINICFNCEFTKPKQYITNERISKVLLLEPSIILYMLKNITNDNNNSIKNLTDLNIEFNYDNDYFKLKVINEFENFHSKKLYNQEFIIRMLYNHNIKLNYIYEIKQTEEQTEEEEEQTEEEQEEIISKIVNAELITRVKYFELLYNGKFSRLNYFEKTKAELFYDNIFINGITNQDNYDTDLYEKINNDLFYYKYITNLKCQYETIKYIINDKFNNLLVSYQSKISNLEEKQNELNFNYSNDSKLAIVKTTLNQLNIDLLKLPYIITNKELNTKLNNEYKDLLLTYIDSSIIDIEEFKKNNNINTQKGLMNLVKKILDYANISIKYIDKRNTTKTYDKLIINYKDFIIKPNYQGRLTKNDMRLEETQIKKIKKGYFYKLNAKQGEPLETEIIPAYKQVIKTINNENIYYTTYKIIQQKLKNRISSYNISKTEINNDLFLEIQNIEIKPYINKDIGNLNDNNYNEYISSKI